MARNNKIVLGTAVIALILLFSGCSHNPAPADNNNSNNTSSTNGQNNNQNSNTAIPTVKLTSPDLNSELSSPVAVEGEMPGTWFFEASAPIKILDANGKVLAQGPVQAQGDWMQTGPVQFKGTFSFTPTTPTGVLVISKDNPSGLPENDQSVSFPLKFKVSGTSDTKPTSTMAVKVYFGNSSYNPNAEDCNLVYPVSRTIPKTVAVGTAAIEQLLAGPTAKEKSADYYTSINPGVKLKSLTIKNGTAYADFDETLEQGVGGSCRTSSIISQIKTTLKQFSTVKDVVISINGKTEPILQP